MASVSFRHVYKRFGDVSVIKDFNLEIADKEFMVFVGPSGCGKSTLLRVLAGLLVADFASLADVVRGDLLGQADGQRSGPVTGTLAPEDIAAAVLDLVRDDTAVAQERAVLGTPENLPSE